MVRCILFTRTGLLIPMGWALFWVTSTSVNQKKDDSTCGTRHSPMVTRERLHCFISFFFHMFLKLLSLTIRGGTPQPLGSYALCQGLIVSLSIYLWLRRVIFTATPMSSRTWGTGPFRKITQPYVLSFKSQQNRGQQGNRIPSWMTKHLVFCSILKRLHDNHRFSANPFGPLPEFKVVLERAQKQTSRELSRKTPDSIGTKLFVACTALRAYRNTHLGTLMRCCEAWKPIENCFDTSSFECVDFPKSLRILLVKLLRNAKLRPRISLGRRQKKTIL